jgi:hypothetical protein
MAGFFVEVSRPAGKQALRFLQSGTVKRLERASFLCYTGKRPFPKTIRKNPVRLCLFTGMICVILASSVAAFAAPADKPVVMGWVEFVTIDAIDAKLKAKLDTGATTSSMRAEVIKIIKGVQKEGSTKKAPRRVVFQVEDRDGKVSTLERKLVRWVRIKDKNGGLQRRPVVDMAFCVGGHHVKSEVNLAPREDFIYPVLVGRNMLEAGRIYVDASRTYVSRARCDDTDEQEDD